MIKKLMTAIFLAFMLISCGDSNSSDLTTLNYNASEEGKTLDQQLATSQSSIQILSFLQEGLSKLDEHLKPVPALAKSWDISEDGLTWTFHLKENLKWSNGDKLTAHDFKFAWLRALKPETASEYAYMLFPIKNAEEYNAGKVKAEEVGIEVLDDLTLKVTLFAPTPYFDSLVAFITYTPANEKFVTEQGENYALEADKILSSGPFSVKSWTHNSNMVLVKNENYYDKDDIKLETVNIKFIKDSSAELNAFKNEEIDIAKLTPAQYQEFKNDERVKQVLLATTWYLEYNVNNKFLSNKKIRKALLLSIDKKEFNEIVSHGINIPAYTLTPKNVGMSGLNGGDFVAEVGDLVPKFNVEKAKQLLAEGLKELGMEKAPVVSLILNDSGANKLFGEAIQEYIRKNLGVEIKIELMAFKERLARMSNNNFDIVLSGWGADYQDPMTFLDLFVTNGGNNHTGYSNPEYDKVIKIAKSTADRKVRFEAMKRAEEILEEDMPIGVLHQPRRNYLVNAKLKNVIFPAIGVDLLFNKSYKVK
ncbi:peptide ABC transporter substrate-binding protein [Caviibacter abscessus]|uniref:peptide ABC transporter substrate-binding protein n=1 Tax=Caviibacter abscessus TaxID=1766719 RepID=UPI000831FBAE|nr:peptide ABC transporter substrate-binding protein [Caviibacter abscessus]